MIKIKIYRKNFKIIKFTIKGHAGYSEPGTDMICASVSVSSMQTLNGIIEVLKLKPEYEMSDGYINCDLSKLKKTEEDKSLNVLLESMYKVLEDIAKQYPEYVKLIEKEVS